MKSECNIIRDLLPLCIEDMASPDSAVFVGKHLEQCADCRREMNRLKNPDLWEQPLPDAEETESLSALRKQLKKQNKLLVAVTAIVSALVVGVLLVSLVLYHLPQRRQVSMPVCNTAGEVSYLEIDVNYYRRLFSTAWVEGTVTFDGVAYHDYYAEIVQSNTQEVGSNSSYWGWDWEFSREKQAMPSNMTFIKTITPTDIWDRFDNLVNRIIFFNVSGSDTFEQVAISYSDRSAENENGSIAGVNFFGPARTVEEARQVAEDLGFKFE